MVKGNITKVSHGTFKEVAKDSHTAVARNVNIDAAGKINQTAKEGIKYGEPNKRTGSKSEYIDVTIGVFFDGTSNNRVNADSKVNNPKVYKAHTGWLSDMDGASTSFKNDHTNVDKLEKFYPKIPNKCFSIYIEGIGTEDNEGDFSAGQMLGQGQTGIPAKVRISCERAVNNLFKYTGKSLNKINKITIDIFGFSRGSAAARYFAYELSKSATDEQLYFSNNTDKQYYISPNSQKPVYLKDPPKSYIHDPKKPLTVRNPAHGYFGEYMELKNIPFLSLEMRFAGLFDSVSSYGVMHSNDVTELHQNAINVVSSIVHLTAADEHRKKFELTHVTKGTELSFPGVHSDIGGGYTDNYNEKDISLVEELDINREEIINKEKERLIEQGWYKSEQMKSDGSKLTGTRTLSNKYSLVPLYIMRDFVKQKCDITVDSNFEDKYKFPTQDKLLNMDTVYRRLKMYSFDNNKLPIKFYTDKEMLNLKTLLNKNQISTKEYELKHQDQKMLLQLRNKYLHWSASWDGVGMEPRINRSGNREREIYNLSLKK